MAVPQALAAVAVVHCHNDILFELVRPGLSSVKLVNSVPLISIVIPVLNEARNIENALQRLQSLRAEVELILVDGGSSDETAALAESLVDSLVESEQGRAVQMNAGAKLANGDWLLFLHADTYLPDDLITHFKQLKSSDVWGRFDVRLSGKHVMFSVIAFMMNWRSALTGVATGDQGIFVRRTVFEDIEGFADLPLMEDIEISKRLRQIQHPVRVRAKVVTSSRRWQDNGIVKTILLMWRLRLQYFFGVKPEQLKRDYQ